jgi:hypothetical protein
VIREQQQSGRETKEVRAPILAVAAARRCQPLSGPAPAECVSFRFMRFIRFTPQRVRPCNETRLCNKTTRFVRNQRLPPRGEEKAVILPLVKPE